MSIKIAKKAFTLAELVLSLTVMIFVAICAINFVFKESSSKGKKVVTKTVNKFVCNQDSKFYNDKIGGCIFNITDEILASEFFEVKLIGGGGGASATMNGENGEERVVVYPSFGFPFEKPSKQCKSPYCLICSASNLCTKCIKGYSPVNGICMPNFYYRIVLGHGGDGGNEPKDGGMTSIQIVGKNIPSDVPSITDRVLGILETSSGGVSAGNSELAPNETSSENNFGGGGMSPNNNGKMGEVVVTW